MPAGSAAGSTESGAYAAACSVGRSFERSSSPSAAKALGGGGGVSAATTRDQWFCRLRSHAWLTACGSSFDCGRQVE
eukprot:6204977-Pleurochrysis_carterae.AAC.7